MTDYGQKSQDSSTLSFVDIVENTTSEVFGASEGGESFDPFVMPTVFRIRAANHARPADHASLNDAVIPPCVD